MTSCRPVTRSRFCIGSFRSRKVRFGRLQRSCEVGEKCHCHFRTTALVCATASRRRSGRRTPASRDCLATYSIASGAISGRSLSRESTHRRLTRTWSSVRPRLPTPALPESTRPDISEPHASLARAVAHKQPPVGAAADDRFARLDVAELTIELATFRWPASDSGGRQARLRRRCVGRTLHMHLVGSAPVSARPAYGEKRFPTGACALPPSLSAARLGALPTAPPAPCWAPDAGFS